jgi:hypothetical protein
MANPKYARLPEREAQQRTVNELDRVLNPSGPFVATSKQLNLDVLRKRQKDEKDRLQAITPPDAETPEEKESLIHHATRLEHAMVKGDPLHGVPPMLTRQQMDEAGAGDVGTELHWQKHWKTHTLDRDGNMVRVAPEQRGAISEWKDARSCLFKKEEEYDPEIASIEMMRPDEKLEGARRGVFSNPLSNKSWPQYEAIMGCKIELSPTQQAIREVEEAGTAVAPSVERIYKTRQAPQNNKNKEGIRFICGELTDTGKVCKSVVRVQGDKCRWHKDKG